MGRVHALKYALMPDVEVQFYELDPERAAAFSSQHRLHAAASFEQLLEWAEAVDVCLPTDLHAPVGQQVLGAGKALLMEKPLTRTKEQGEQLIRAAEGKVAMAAQVVRYFPEFERAHQLVKGGSVGTPAAIRMRRGGKMPASTWFRDRERSGGLILDVGVHEFDWILWTLGPVKRVTARLASVSRENLEMPGDYALVTLELESKAVAHVELTWLDPSGFRTHFEVCGSGGMIETDNRRVSSLKFTNADGGQVFESPQAPDVDPYYRQLRGFVDAVQGKGPVPVPLTEGHAAVLVALAALESAETGQTIAL